MHCVKVRGCKPLLRGRKPGLTGHLAGLGCAVVLGVLLTACQQHTTASNAKASAGGIQTAQPSSPAANASPGDQPPADANAADLANAAQTPEEAAHLSMTLAQQNADCVDQLIRSQPFGETRTQIIDNVTKACLPIATWATQSSQSPPAAVERSERAFVAAQAHDLIDGPAPSGTPQQPAQPPPHPPTNETAPPPPSNATPG